MILHLHEARLGAALPTRTVRPWRRRGDDLLAAFATALREPADRVVLTGAVFDRADPPAHVVDRAVAPLGALVRRGVEVRAPAETPRSLLLLAAGIRLGGNGVAGEAPPFWRTGAFRIFDGDAATVRRVELPATVHVSLDVTGLSAAEALDRLARRLRDHRGAYVRVALRGRTEEPELRAFGPRELARLLPPGADGTVANGLDPPPPPRDFEDDAARRDALARSRGRLPDLPAATGIYEFVDRRGRVLYVGKAVDIRRRVASHYTAEAREPSPRGPMLLEARTVRWRATDSELSAFLAEADRIREVRPPYNRQMREREGFRYLRADLAVESASLSSRAAVLVDGATWYGPFPKRYVVDRSLRVLQVACGLPSCDWRPGADAPAVCTDRDLGVCAAPCVGRASPAEVRDRVRMALDHLLGGGATPRFGALNPLSAGLLTADDLRILAGFARSLRWLLGCLATSGTVPLPDGRVLLVLGGLAAGELAPGPAVDRRIADHARLPPRTWVPVERAEEVRILGRAVRARSAHPSPAPGDRGREGALPLTEGAPDEDPRDA